MNLNLTLVGQFITFALFVWFTMKFVWPHIIEAMEQRQDKIADGLAAAERGKRDLELAQHKAADMLRDAKLKAAEIVEQANKRGVRIVEDAKEDGRKTGERMIDMARDEISQEQISAREELQQEIASLAIATAEKILAKSIDESANNSMIDELISQVSSSE